jgi:hypothetical protein
VILTRAFSINLTCVCRCFILKPHFPDRARLSQAAGESCDLHPGSTLGKAESPRWAPWDPPLPFRGPPQAPKDSGRKQVDSASPPPSTHSRHCTSISHTSLCHWGLIGDESQAFHCFGVIFLRQGLGLRSSCLSLQGMGLWVWPAGLGEPGFDLSLCHSWSSSLTLGHSAQLDRGILFFLHTKELCGNFVLQFPLCSSQGHCPDTGLAVTPLL